eukprot:1660624-Pyramimonas_sp.AAC.1
MESKTGCAVSTADPAQGATLERFLYFKRPDKIPPQLCPSATDPERWVPRDAHTPATCQRIGAGPDSILV